MKPLAPHIRTYTGAIVNPLSLRRQDINITDIAHALALVNRFGGHTKMPISVAQHSVYVSRLVPSKHALQGLLHDASEAYLCDIPKWVKASAAFAAYRSIERRAQRLIYERFGLPTATARDVEQADRLMVRFEGTRGFARDWLVGHKEYPPVTPAERQRLGPWRPMDWRAAEKLFLKTFKELAG